MELTRESLDPIIARHFVAEAITEGLMQKQAYIRYTGRFFRPETAPVHDELMDLLEPYGMTVLFREEDGQQVIYVMNGIPQTAPNRPWINLVLLIVTFLSMFISGSMYSLPETTTEQTLFRDIFLNLPNGWPFAVSLIAILASHEFGHYLIGRWHKTPVTLPFFIPFPFSTLGTMGAFIQMKGVPRNRNHLLDIGLAGPLAGLAVTIPILIYGLHISKVETLPTILAAGQGLQMEGNSIVYLLLKYLVKGQLLPAPAGYGDVSPLIYWVRYFFTGMPYPLGGKDIMLSQVAWAGWAGLLVTMLNLIPAGQLDGGHAFYVLFGKKGLKVVLPVILVILAALGWFWNGWWLWVVLILVFGRNSAEPLDQLSPLDGQRKILGAAALIIFILIFMPVPLSVVGM